jgi:hypothetical protein
VRSTELFPLSRVETSVRAFWGSLFLFLIASAALAQNESPFQVEIDLQQQKAYLIRGLHLVLQSPISSGRYGHLTEAGTFKVLEKELNHHSSIYGKIVDAYGRTVVADADVDMKVPPGGKFIPAPMHYFMRFHGADGLHAGYLPGYPASHGCVRMPEQLAIAFFNSVEVGTPVTVFGRTPRTNEYSRYGLQPRRERWPWFGRQFGPTPFQRYDPRYPQPSWQ